MAVAGSGGQPGSIAAPIAPPGLIRVTGNSVALLGIAMSAALVAASWTSPPLFAAIGVAMAGFLACASYRWPNVMLVMLVVAPLGDPHLLDWLTPEWVTPLFIYFTEALLLVVGIPAAVRALREGTLLPALGHPVTISLAAFTALAVVSAFANAVPPTVAGAGVLFTVDAVALFYLARMVRFTERHVVAAGAAFVGAMSIAAVFALVQALAPELLGSIAFEGWSVPDGGVTSFVGNPNILAAMLAPAIPFPLFAMRVASGRARWLAIGVAFLLILALLLTFSRAGWIAVVVGVAAIALIRDRRALGIAALVIAVAFTAYVTVATNVLGTSPSTEAESQAVPGTGVILGSSDQLRLQLVSDALRVAGDHPVLGVGPGRYGGATAHLLGSPVYEEYAISLYGLNSIHSFWLHVLAEFGIAGTLAFVSAIAFAVWPVLRASRTARGWRRAMLLSIAAAAVVISVHSLGEMLLEGNKVAFTFWFLVGLGASLATRPPPESVVGTSPADEHAKPAERTATG